MSDLFELAADVRSDKGKGASRRLRRETGHVPGIIYGGGEAPQMLTFSENKLHKALENESFYSHILTINVEGKKQKAVLKALQRHPFKRQIVHIDLLRVTGKEVITMHVPLHFTNEEDAPGVVAGGLVSHIMTDLEIKCLPKDLPEFIEIDISHLELDHSLHLSDIKLPAGVKLAMAALDEAHDHPVVSIHLPRQAKLDEEEAAAEVAPGDVPATEVGADDEAGEEKDGKDAE